MKAKPAIGIVGGSGALGGAIARACLKREFVNPSQLWISNRSGTTEGFEDWPGVNFTSSNQELADKCDVVVLSVPPKQAFELKMAAKDRLVISVMAGVTIKEIQRLTGSQRVVRAMSSPVAENHLAYSPWCTLSDLAEEEKAFVQAFLSCCGLSDEVPGEDQIDHFTALTGPVPGFVALFAECLEDYAVKNGIDPKVANRAVRQLFLAGGITLSQSSLPPGKHVQEMIDYAGTTAAGLNEMKNSALADIVHQGLDAAYRKAQTIAHD